MRQQNLATKYFALTLCGEKVRVQKKLSFKNNFNKIFLRENLKTNILTNTLSHPALHSSNEISNNYIIPEYIKFLN
jgi:hypothetical protein